MGVTACGGSGNENSADRYFDAGLASDGTRLGEYSLGIDARRFRAGQIGWRISNDGRLEHEFVIVRTDLGERELPVDDDRADLEAAGEVIADVDVSPGESRQETVAIEPGDYVVLCNLPGHYDRGQSTYFRAYGPPGA